MNRTIWSGRISRGCLVLPLAESTYRLDPVALVLSRWVLKNRDSAASFGQPFQFLLLIDSSLWHCNSGCRDPGGFCSFKLPSIHWPLSQLGVVLFLVQDFFRFPSAHFSSWTLNCWPFESDGSPRWNCTGPSVAARTTGEGELTAHSGRSRDSWKTWYSNLKGDSGEHFGSYLGTIN